MNKKVLVVEDDASIQKAISVILEGNHRHVMPASNVQGALLLAPEADVILLDMKLGRETGDEFLESLRKMGFYTPVIVISGIYSRETVEERLGKYKIVDFIGKPFKAKELLDKVTSAEKLSGALESTCEAADRFSAAATSLRILAGKSITEIGKGLLKEKA